MRVLIVEDSAKMATLLRRGLERERYAVDVVDNGRDAIWMAGENAYDAVVLDVVLDGAGPGMDGFDVCRTLRANACWSPVLMVTARDAVRDRVQGLDAGADDYLPKPFSFQELSARLRALIRRGGRERPVVLEVGDLSLDPVGHRVLRSGRTVELTATEFAILECFMRRPGQTLSRRDVLEHVWDFGFDGDPRIVTVYVRSLRNKIDRPFGRASLETVRGVGYRLRE
jgi:two-component system, OmpR family, response regulator